MTRRTKRSPKKARRRNAAIDVSQPTVPVRVRKRHLHAVPDVIETEERAPQGPRKPSEGAIIGSLPLSLQLSRIGGNLRPVDVSNIIQDADSGYVSRLMDLANEARQKDGHLQGVLYTRETTLASLPWRMEPFAIHGQKPKAKDAAIAQWTEDRLMDIYGNPAVDLGAPDDLSSLRGLFAHMAGGAYYGFAPAEVMWTRSLGYVVPIGFSLLQQRRWLYRQEDGRLCWWDNGMPVPIDVMRTYAPGKFLIHRPRINGDIGCREGLVRPLMWAALFRNWAIRDWMSLAELAWKPYRTGSYSRDATKADKDNLIAALKALSASGVGVFADTTKFMVEWPKHSVSSGQSMHGELAAFFAGEISKCVLGQTLTTEAGQKGARALGEVHERVRGDIAEADAISAGNTLQAQLIGPMVRLNFGIDAKMPRFRFVTEQTSEIDTFSKGIVQLRTAGTEVPAKWVRDRVGMPQILPGEEVLGPMMPNAMAVAAQTTADAPPDTSASPQDGQNADQGTQG